MAYESIFTWINLILKIIQIKSILFTEMNRNFNKNIKIYLLYVNDQEENYSNQ